MIYRNISHAIFCDGTRQKNWFGFLHDIGSNEVICE
jgi:hypothetical protein